MNYDNFQRLARGRGHTHAAINGAVESKALLVVINEQHGRMLKKEYPTLKTMNIHDFLGRNYIGNTDPVVFDHAAVQQIILKLTSKLADKERVIRRIKRIVELEE